MARVVEVAPKDRQARSYIRDRLFYLGDLEGYRHSCREQEAILVAESKDLSGGALLGHYPSNRPRTADPSSSTPGFAHLYLFASRQLIA